MRLTAPLVLAPLLALGAGCAAMVDMAKEGMLGFEKREILVDRVQDAKEEQADAQAQFKTTLEAFQELTGHDGGDLEAMYKRFKAEYEDSVEAADDVSSRIDRVRTVAESMFKEWEGELDDYTDDATGRELRRKSEEQIRDTRSRYEELMSSMEAAEASMAPVLGAFRNQVTYLKSSLNAQALASLSDVKVEIEGDIANLISNMERSIAEAQEFIQEYEGGGA